MKLRVHPGCFRHAFSHCPLGPVTPVPWSLCVHLRAGGGGDLWRRQHSGGHCGGGGHTCHTQGSPGSTGGGRYLPRRWVRRRTQAPPKCSAACLLTPSAAPRLLLFVGAVLSLASICCRRSFVAYPPPTPMPHIPMRAQVLPLRPWETCCRPMCL